MITENINTNQQQILDFIRSLKDKQISKSNLISYTLQIDDINFYSLIENFEKQKKDYSYYSKPEQNFFVLAIGETISYSFENIEQLNEFTPEFLKMKSNILSNFNEINFNPPLFFFTAKFPSSKSSEEWKVFDPVRLFIPETVFLKTESKTFMVVNISANLNRNGYPLSEQLANKINYFSNINNISHNFKKLNSKINLCSLQNFTVWKQKVNKVLSEIKSRKYDKIVLSRYTEFELTDQFSESALAAKLDQKYPECFNFLYKVNSSLFFSASPEKLFIIEKGEIFTEALAGSIERGNNESEDKILERVLSKSAKDANEHRFVIDHLKTVLDKHCDKVTVDNSPSLRKLTNIQHLHTGLSGKVKKGFELFQLIKDIFPTPAVGGYPTRSTLKVIDQIEDFDRGLFTGFFGWVNSNNDGEFIVSIRSGLINENRLFVYAGCGIVSGSDPQREFEETQLKSEAIISLFQNENKN